MTPFTGHAPSLSSKDKQGDSDDEEEAEEEGEQEEEGENSMSNPDASSSDHYLSKNINGIPVSPPIIFVPNAVFWPIIKGVQRPKFAV